jgi:hypothetical protein
MAAGKTRRVFAFEVHGLRDPGSNTSTAPMLFSTEVLNGAVFTAAFPTHTVKPWVRPEDVSGYNWSSDPRRIVGSGGQCSVKLLDPLGTLGLQLMRNAKSDYFDIQDARIEQGGTTIRTTGKPGTFDAPNQNDIYWIEGEAVQVTSAPARVTGGRGTYSMTIARGLCGSRDVLHRLDPVSFNPGKPGDEDRMFLDTRPNFSSYLFTGAIYLFRLDQEGAVSDYIKRFMYLSETPTPLMGRKYEFKLKDIGGLLAEHQLGAKSREVTLSHKIRINEINTTAYGVGQLQGLDIPTKITLGFTRFEADRFFREPLKNPSQEKLQTAFVTALSTRMIASAKAVWMAEVDCSGKWLYRMTGGLSYQERVRSGDSSTNKTPFVEAQFELVDRENNIEVTTANGLASGWSLLPAVPVGSAQGDDPVAPKVSLRLVLQTTPMQALLALCCSDGGATSDPYDILPGRVGLGLPSAWFNLGATVADPLTLDVGTTELLARDQLLDEIYQYHLPLKNEIKLGDFLSSDICVLHSLLFGPLQSGKYTAIPFARVATGAIYTMPTISTQEVAPGARLDRVRSLELSSGFRPLTLEPEFVRSVRARDARLRNAKDGGESQSIRVWQPGNHISDQDITSGSLTTLVRSFLDLYGGEPIVYEVPTTMDFIVDNTVEFGAFVSWSNNDVLSYNGTGVSGNFILFGYNLNWKTGEVTARLIQDTFNSGYVDLVSGADSVTAPAFRPSKVTLVGVLTYEIEVDAIAQAGVDLSGSGYGGIFRDLVTDAGRVRVTRSAHNPQGETERDGHLEAYGVVTAVRFDNGKQRSVVTVQFDASWERGGKTIARDILIPGESLLSLTDRRPEGAHPQAATTIEPTLSQLYNNGGGINFTKVAAQSFDKVLHVFGA